MAGRQLARLPTTEPVGDGGQVEQNMIYYTYVLRSKMDGKLYIGWTDDLKNRIKEHNSGSVESTRPRIPFELVYFEGCADRKKAIKREKYFKSGFGRNFLKNRI